MTGHDNPAIVENALENDKWYNKQPTLLTERSFPLWGTFTDKGADCVHTGTSVLTRGP